MPASFSVVVVTAAPPGFAAEGGGAFVKIDGREALLRSAELFLNRENVKQVHVIVSSDAFDEAKRKYGGHFGFAGVKLVSATGSRWMDHVVAGGKVVSGDASHVILHDAARPAVAYSDIEALMEAAEQHPIVSLTSPVRSPLIEVDDGGSGLSLRAPGEFVQMLTPQAFARDRFMKMVESQAEPHASELTLLKGSPLNIRIAGPGDAALVRAMLNMLPKPKVKPPSSPFEEAQW